MLIISLHVPANKESYHLFDKAMFNHVKKGAILMLTYVANHHTPDLIAAVNDGTLLMRLILMKMKQDPPQMTGLIKTLTIKHY